MFSDIPGKFFLEFGVTEAQVCSMRRTGARFIHAEKLGVRLEIVLVLNEGVFGRPGMLAGNIAECSMTKVGHDLCRYNLRINSALQ